MQQNAKKRIAWIDVYKGLLIILVVMGHVISSYHASSRYLDSVVLNFCYKFIYSFHMSAFMFISGVLFNYKHDIPAKKQVLKKFLEYGIPYIVFSLVWFIFKILCKKFTNSSLSIYDLLLIPIFPISFMWFIYALLIIEILQILVDRKGQKIKIIYFVIVCLLFFIKPILDYYLVDIRWDDFILKDVLNFYIYFIIGHYFGKKIIKFVEKKIKICLWVSVIFILITNIITFKYSFDIPLIIKIIIGMGGCFFIIAISHTIQNNTITYIGKNTLPIYVLQGIIIAATRVLISKVGCLNDQLGMIPFIICSFSGTICPLIIYEICCKFDKLDFAFYPTKYIKI